MHGPIGGGGNFEEGPVGLEMAASHSGQKERAQSRRGGDHLPPPEPEQGTALRGASQGRVSGELAAKKKKTEKEKGEGGGEGRKRRRRRREKEKEMKKGERGEGKGDGERRGGGDGKEKGEGDGEGKGEGEGG